VSQKTGKQNDQKKRRQKQHRNEAQNGMKSKHKTSENTQCPKQVRRFLEKSFSIMVKKCKKVKKFSKFKTNLFDVPPP
jgi:hypothetical protein